MAAAFKFRLEPVLRLRERVFDDKQRLVAKRLRAIGREQSLKAAAESELNAHLGELRTLQEGGRVDVANVRGSRAHVLFLHRRIAECEERIAGHERELVRERAEMVAARVDVRALEKLKERRAARFAEVQARRESNEQAEIALQLHRRVSQSEPRP